MCLIIFAYQAHPKFPLILAANRDEFYERPTQRIHWWDQDPQLLAGKDLKAGGTWMGVHTSGRFAALTNFRDLSQEKKDAPSRGKLVLDFLQGSHSPSQFLRQLQPSSSQYSGYNLLVWEKGELAWQSNMQKEWERVRPGIHGLSNHLLDTPWPKVEKGKRSMESIVSNQKEISVEDLFALLSDRSIATDAQLPQTGVSLKWERLLSAMHIESEGYGTRVSTVIMIDHRGKVFVEERAFAPKGEALTFTLTFPIVEKPKRN
ncbi:MAG: NRDE family protein [Bacteroidota bacterium]